MVEPTVLPVVRIERLDLTSPEYRWKVAVRQIASALKPYGLELRIDVNGDYSVEKIPAEAETK